MIEDYERGYWNGLATGMVIAIVAILFLLALVTL